MWNCQVPKKPDHLSKNARLSSASIQGEPRSRVNVQRGLGFHQGLWQRRDRGELMCTASLLLGANTRGAAVFSKQMTGKKQLSSGTIHQIPSSNSKHHGREARVGFTTLCKSDPILAFIRATYNAIPLKVPDSRFAPLTVFTSKDRRVRYLGDFTPFVPPERLAKIKTETKDLTDLSGRVSNSMSFSVVFDLLGPFLTHLLALTQLDLAASVNASAHKDVGVRISLGGSKRTYVQTVLLPLIFKPAPIDFPALSLVEDGNGKQHPLFLIDAILSAKEITLSWDDDSGHDVSAKLESAIAGHASANSVLRTKSRLVITGTHRAPFAFTCVELVSNQSRQLTNVKLSSREPRFGLADVGKVHFVDHVAIGDEDELIDFDE